MRGNARLSVSDIRRYYFVLLHAQLKEFGIFAMNCFKVNAPFFFFYTFHKFHQKVDYAELFMSTVYSILNHSVLAKARTVRVLFSHRPLLFFVLFVRLPAFHCVYCFGFYWTLCLFFYDLGILVGGGVGKVLLKRRLLSPEVNNTSIPRG